jgi:hypothetical protein
VVMDSIALWKKVGESGGHAVMYVLHSIYALSGSELFVVVLDPGTVTCLSVSLWLRALLTP